MKGTTRHPGLRLFSLIAVCLTAPGLALVSAPGALAAPGATAARGAVQKVTGDPRVDKLISEMTLDEKLTLLSGAQEAAATNQFTAGYLPGIPRLGIPSLRLADGPPGVATKEPSTGMTVHHGRGGHVQPAGRLPQRRRSSAGTRGRWAWTWSSSRS